ncbi:MAG: DUF4087 domain-containing protein [Novosphingobium sp.]|nr:DUF4087 domain-containing protein [Novosphingobium sp.]
MRGVLAICIGAGLASVALASARAPEKRCGILANPTPANWWLNDRDGEWIIGTQGGFQAEGIDVMPESFYKKGWVRTNGNYGYRCACLTVDSDRKNKRITRIRSAQALPMKRCNADKALQRALGRGD